MLRFLKVSIVFSLFVEFVDLRGCIDCSDIHKVSLLLFDIHSIDL